MEMKGNEKEEKVNFLLWNEMREEEKKKINNGNKVTDRKRQDENKIAWKCKLEFTNVNHFIYILSDWDGQPISGY